MPTNIEIKARARDWDAQLRRARAMADACEEIPQHDTFFHCDRGRLKLREFADGSAELIAYRRPDETGPKASEYEIAPVVDAAAARRVMSVALGQARSVRKHRTLVLCGQTRIHFDDVAGLGRFIELEVVLRPGQPRREGEAIARKLMAELAIQSGDLIDGAYVDMMS